MPRRAVNVQGGTDAYQEDVEAGGRVLEVEPQVVNLPWRSER